MLKRKDEIDRSTLYSFDGPFQLLHAGAGKSEFLGKSAADPKFVLLCVDLFTSKVYIYPMKLGNPLRVKWKFSTRNLKRKEKVKRQGFRLTRNLRKK